MLIIIPLLLIFFILWACLRCASIADEEIEKSNFGLS